MDHSKMDHSQMDHGMMASSEESMEDDHMGMAHMGGMMMQMYFTASSRVTILFEGWATKDAGQLFGSMVCNSYSGPIFSHLNDFMAILDRHLSVGNGIRVVEVLA